MGMKYSAKIDRNGEVLEFSSLEAAINEIIATTDASEADKALMSEQIKETFGDQTLKNNMVELVSFYPGKMVSANDSWNQEKKIDSFIQMIVETIPGH